MISKYYIRRVMLLIMMLEGFRIQATLPIPLMRELEALVIIGLLFFVLYRVVIERSVSHGASLSIFEAYILTLCLLPVFAAIRAFFVFDQPVIYGLLTQRYIWLSIIAMVLIYTLKKDVIRLKDIHDALIFLAWAALIGYISLGLFVSPEVFSDYSEFVAGGELNGYKYDFEVIPIVFGFFYYISKAYFEKIQKYYYYAVPFLFCLIAVIDKRSLVIAVILVLSYFIMKYKSIVRISLAFVWLLSALFIIGLALYLLFPILLIEAFNHFYSAFQVLLLGEIGSDDSSNARVYEMALAMPYIQENLFFGNGDLSVQWHDGFRGEIGYFYPSDIGFMGALFVYGLLALSFVYWQFYYLFKITKQRKTSNAFDAFYLALMGSILVLLIQSFIKGGILFSPAVSLVFISILHHYKLVEIAYERLLNCKDINLPFSQGKNNDSIFVKEMAVFKNKKG